MDIFFQLALSGLKEGALFALIALSLTVVYRATTIVNFGHGDFVMAGAFCALLLFDYYTSINKRAPDWYPRLRWPLTLIVVASLIFSAFQ